MLCSRGYCFISAHVESCFTGKLRNPSSLVDSKIKSCIDGGRHRAAPVRQAEGGKLIFSAVYWGYATWRGLWVITKAALVRG